MRKSFLTPIVLLVLGGCALLPFVKSGNSGRTAKRWFSVELEIRNDNTANHAVVRVFTRHPERLECSPPRYSDLRNCELVVPRGRAELYPVRWEGEVEVLSDGSEFSRSYIDIELRPRMVTIERADVGSLSTGRVCHIRLGPEDIARVVSITRCY